MSEVRGRPLSRIGIDLGGTKIAGVALDDSDCVLCEIRIPAPKHDYGATLQAMRSIVDAIERDTGTGCSVGVGMPGSIAPRTGLVQNANSTWLNGKPFKADIEAVLCRPVRIANDANCFALSEAHDGSAAGTRTVFGVIIGTGCGGGIVIDGLLLDGPRAIAGEWGHTPLPWMSADELGATTCWCGRTGCLETWLSGSGLEADYQRATGNFATGEEIVSRSLNGETAAAAALARHAHRLARGLAGITNILDPDVIVLGGGLSGLAHLYNDLPTLIRPFVFAEDTGIDIRRPRWGDASGVRGAARLWD